MRMRYLFCGALLLALASPLAAPARTDVTPKAGFYRTVGGGESGGSFRVAAGAIAPGATAQSDFKCNKMNASVAKKIPVSNGAFSYSGPSRLEPAVTIAWTGKWTSPTSVGGTVQLKVGDVHEHGALEGELDGLIAAPYGVTSRLRPAGTSVTVRRRRSATPTRPWRTFTFVPSQRSAVSQLVPRIVAEA
jgi:hypothetical protein